MSYANPIWPEGQRRYWLRHDWQRFIRHDAHRFLTPAGIAEEKRAAEAETAARRNAAEIDAAELAALRRDHERVRIELADVKFALALRALGRKYSPDQPRVPAGSPDGGQWTSGGGGTSAASGSVRLAGTAANFMTPTQTVLSDATPDPIVPGAQYAQNTTQSRYSVNLNEEEARGGHTLRDHVGKTDDELMSIVKPDRGSAGVYRYARVRHGSFESPESANDLVNRTLERNQNVVDQVANGKLEQTFLKERFGYRTGREAFRPDIDAEPYLRDTYEVGVNIRYDPTGIRGYRVHTAYPRNERPR